MIPQFATLWNMKNSTERTDRYRYFPNHRLNVARERPFASVFYPFPNVGWTIMPHVRETPAPRCGWQLKMTLRRIGAKYLQATKHPVGKPFSLIRKNCAAAYSVPDRALRNNVLRSGRRAHRTIGKSDRTVWTVVFHIPPSLTSLLPISPQFSLYFHSMGFITVSTVQTYLTYIIQLVARTVAAGFTTVLLPSKRRYYRPTRATCDVLRYNRHKVGR
jgi:hypothetical protein